MQSSSLLHPESFHPPSSAHESPAPAHSFLNCSLHLHYALPHMLFVDPFELTNRAAEYTFKYAGPSNLELPVAALDEDEDDAALLVTVAQPLPSDGVLEVEGPAPCSLRPRCAQTRPSRSPSYPGPPYSSHVPQNPVIESESNARLPPMPHAFALPFAGKRITHLPPPPGAVPTELIRTPVGDTADVARVELGTALVVLLAFVYLVRATRRTGGAERRRAVFWGTSFERAPRPTAHHEATTAPFGNALHWGQARRFTLLLPFVFVCRDSTKLLLPRESRSPVWTSRSDECAFWQDAFGSYACMCLSRREERCAQNFLLLARKGRKG
ncbi:hypothetical protein C8R46DRAFT_1288113 [Mycena filopes]|nr:hypothetical protein C8R46DRAFT_1288113 [Mycena filopes]